MSVKTLAEARYLLEHRQLPNYLYKNKKDSIKGLLELSHNLAYTTFKNSCEENGIDFPYKETDFKATKFMLTDNIEAVKLEMPEPTDETQCYYIYFVYKLDFSKMYYFTVEKELHKGEQKLGGWTKKAHFNHGLVGISEEEQRDKMLDVIMNSPILNKN